MYTETPDRMRGDYSYTRYIASDMTWARTRHREIQPILLDTYPQLIQISSSYSLRSTFLRYEKYHRPLLRRFKHIPHALRHQLHLTKTFPLEICITIAMKTLLVTEPMSLKNAICSKDQIVRFTEQCVKTSLMYSKQSKGTLRYT